jgi:hypothetical protein
MKSSTCFCRLVSGIGTKIYCGRIKGERQAQYSYLTKVSAASFRYVVFEDVPMISIRESISELERSEQLRSLAQDCYLSAIKNLIH